MFFHHALVFNFIPHNLIGKKIVEGGCGKGIYGFLLRATRDLTRSKLVGMDVSSDYLKVAKYHKIYDEYIIGDLKKLVFPSRSIDLFLAIEVIAHLSKSNGFLFLSQLSRVCRGRAIIVTPNDTMHNQPEFVFTDSHHSRWTVEDFQNQGFKVYGFGLKIPTPKKSWHVKIYFALQYIFTPITYFLPELAGYLIAVKDY